MTTSGYLPAIGWLPDAESTTNRNSHISFGAKLSGKPGAGKRHAGFDVAGTGNVNNGSRTEGQNESAGIITEPQSQRASSRPYLRGAGGEIPLVYSPKQNLLVLSLEEIDVFGMTAMRADNPFSGFVHRERVFGRSNIERNIGRHA